MSILTRRIWSFLRPNGYITKEDRMQLAVGYNRYPASSVSSFWDTLVRVVLGFLGGGVGGGYGIPNVATVPYTDLKNGYIFLSDINIKERSGVPYVKVECIDEIKISVELL